MSALPAGPPPYNPEAEPFWTAAAESRLALPVCDACHRVIWYPRAWCPACGGDAVTWTEMSGRGAVYARTVLRKGMGPWAAAAPYVVAYVELDEGPRILANVVTDQPDAVGIGQAVQADFVPVADPAGASPATHLLRFRPTSTPPDG